MLQSMGLQRVTPGRATEQQLIHDYLYRTLQIFSEISIRLEKLTVSQSHMGSGEFIL